MATKVLEIKQEIVDINPEALLADGLDDALIGYTCSGSHDPVAVYDTDKCIKIIKKTHGIDDEEAEDYLSYNIIRGLDYCDENAPIFIKLPY